jgi:hypothetical protein
MAETSLQQCLSALCNAGDSVNLRSLVDHFRYLKVSMIWLRELQREINLYSFSRACTVTEASTVLAMVRYIDYSIDSGLIRLIR